MKLFPPQNNNYEKFLTQLSKKEITKQSLALPSTNNKQNKLQLEQIMKSLRKPTHERFEWDIKQITNWLHNINIFKNMSNQILSQVAYSLRLRVFSDGQICWYQVRFISSYNGRIYLIVFFFFFFFFSREIL